MTDPTIHHDRRRSRYEAHLDGRLAGFAEYRLEDGRIVFDHTVTVPEFGGRGVASSLARRSLEEVRERGDLRVVARCSFYADYIAKHPEFADLLAE